MAGVVEACGRGRGAQPGGGALVQTAAPRQVLRADRHPDGGLVVEAGDDVRGRTRVDDDVVGLMRTVTRQLAADPSGTVAFSRELVALSGVHVGGAGPVEAVLRATYPLLGAVEPWPMPALPGSLPPRLQPAFRQRDPRSAARVLFGGRATRPVVRALAGALTAEIGTIDLFRLTVAVAFAPRLEPDHLVRLLQAPGTATGDRAPLADDDADRLVALLADVPVRRGLSLLTAAMASEDDRARVRYLLDAATNGRRVDLQGVRSWRSASTAVAPAVPDVDEVLAAAAPVEVPAHPDWELRLARTGRDLVRLSRTLDNCLDTYVGRLDTHDRIVEVVDRHRARTAYAVHLRHGRVVEFKGHANREPAATIQREVVALLDQHGGFASPDPPPRVEVGEDSLRSVAARWLAADRGDALEWPEVGIAFWLAGLLHELPDPATTANERVVRDLAEMAVTGRLGEVARRARTRRDLDEAERALRPAATPWTRAGWQRLTMLDAIRGTTRSTAQPGRAGRQ